MPRSRTRALAKQAEAVRLFSRGCTFQEIARRVGYANRGTAHRVVTNAYREQIVADIEHHRLVELENLNKALRSLWRIIDDENTPVHETIRAIAEAGEIIWKRTRLLGLDCHRCDQYPQTVILGKATQERQPLLCLNCLETTKAPEAGGPDARSGPPAKVMSWS